MTFTTRTTVCARGGAVAAAVAMTLVACGSEPTPTPTPTDGTTQESDQDSGAVSEVDVPDTAVGRVTRWVLDQLAAEAGPDEAEAAQRFAPVFLEEIPPDQVSAVFAQLRARGPFTAASYAEQADSAQTELVGAGDGRFVLSVSVDDDERIQGLFLQPLTEVPEITEPGQAAEAVTEAAEHASFLLAEVDETGACEPVVATGAEELLPIGSIFKLYVLGAVVAAVAEDDVGWGDTLTLTEETRSLPSGTLQDEPAGTEVSVQEAATAMIEISDNTATDLLIEAVGRDRVEAAMAEMGHDAPEVNTPFLTTREMFHLSMADPDLREAWSATTGEDPLSTDPAVSRQQRELLADLPAWDRTLDESLAADPAWPEGLDWFATATDLCAAHLALQDLAATPAGEPVRAILAENPGITPAEGVDYVGFKGGSAPGEMAGAWYTETADGAPYVLVIQLADGDDPAGVPDGGWLGSVAGQVLTGVATR